MIGHLLGLLAMVAVAAGDAPSGGATAQEPTVTPYAAPPVPAPAPQPSDELPIAIVWNAPGECPGIDALKAEIRRVAGQVPPPSERLSAEITVRRGTGTGWLLTLVTTAGTRAGERKLTGSDCAELMRAAALVMALMINPQASLAPEPLPLPPPLPPPPPPSDDALPQHRFAAGADLLVGTGALPGVAPGIGLRFGVAAAAFSAELRAGIWMSRNAASPADATAGGSFDLVEGTVAACVHARRTRRLSPGLCGGESVVRLHGSGYGVSNPADASAWWNAALAEVNLRLQFTSHHAARLAAQGVFPLGKPDFALAGVGHVFQPASIWLRGTVGWELHF